MNAPRSSSMLKRSAGSSGVAAFSLTGEWYSMLRMVSTAPSNAPASELASRAGNDRSTAVNA